MPRRPDPLRLVFGGLSALLVLYLVLPIAGLAGALGNVGTVGLPPGEVSAALGTSALTATLATLAMLLFGVPFSYLLARSRLPGRTVLGALVLLPLALPPLVGGLLLVQLFGPYAPLGVLAARFGLQSWDSRLAIVLAQLFVAAPYLIVTARTAFAALDPAVEEVAATLGAGPWTRFRLVALPLAGAGIAAGALLAWVRAFGEFGATMVMAYHPYSLPVLTWVALSGTGVPAALPLAAIAVLAAAAVALLLGLAPAFGQAGMATTAPAEGDLEAGGGPIADDAQQVGGLALATANGHDPLFAPGLLASRSTDPARDGDAALRIDFRAHLGSFHLDVVFEGQAQMLALFGPSGAGKSATLRAIAGLLTPDAGSICLGEAVLFEAGKVDVSVHRRRVGYVLQASTLLPHLDVAANVAFGVRHLAVGRRAQAVQAALRVTGLEAFAQRRPHQLSGGQQQRVALARALAAAPRLLLFDEPFSALDAPVRRELRHLVRSLQRHAGLPAVFVTHDLAEAAELSDRLVLLDGGHVLQQGPTAEVLARPRSVKAARLLGFQNVLPARVGNGLIRLEQAPVRLATTNLSDDTGQPVYAAIRAEHVILETSSMAGPNRVEAIVESGVALGGLARVTCLLAGCSPPVRVHVLMTHSAARPLPGADDRCTLHFPPADLLALPAAATVPALRSAPMATPF